MLPRLYHAGQKAGRRSELALSPDCGGTLTVSLGFDPFLQSLSRYLGILVRDLLRYYDRIRLLTRVHRVYDCVERRHSLPLRWGGCCVLFRLRTSALENWISQLNTEPMVSPVNTSHTISRWGCREQDFPA